METFLYDSLWDEFHGHKKEERHWKPAKSRVLGMPRPLGTQKLFKRSEKYRERSRAAVGYVHVRGRKQQASPQKR